MCPSTSAWNSIAGRTDNALENLRSATENGLRHGATGCLCTDWGDNGHWQTLPVSYLSFAKGAAYGWAYELGNVYRETVSPETLRTTLAVIDRAVARLNEGQSIPIIHTKF